MVNTGIPYENIFDNVNWHLSHRHYVSSIDYEMVLIPAGTFFMGRRESEYHNKYVNEGPQHEIVITRPFYLGKYLVTQKQWCMVMQNNPSKTKSDNHPVENINWFECVKFFNKLGGREGFPVLYNTELEESKWEANLREQGFRFPTEAEWEYACRAGTKTLNYWESKEVKEIDRYAWHGKNTGANLEHQEVGLKEPNNWKLYDMVGNVNEWCEDCYEDNYYMRSPKYDPVNNRYFDLKVIRGGNPYTLSKLSSTCRSGFEPDTKDSGTGVRIALGIKYSGV